LVEKTFPKLGLKNPILFPCLSLSLSQNLVSKTTSLLFPKKLRGVFPKKLVFLGRVNTEFWQGNKIWLKKPRPFCFPKNEVGVFPKKQVGPKIWFLKPNFGKGTWKH
jgi:hypothetical protein